VVEPVSNYRARLWPPLAALGLGGLAALTLALVAAFRIGRRVLWPVDWLTQKAERVAATGGAAEIMRDPMPVRVREFVRLREAVLQAHMALRARAAAITATEARLRAIVDTAVDAIVVFDEAGAIQSANPAAKTIFGYEEDEIIDLPVRVLLTTGNDAQHDPLLDALQQTVKRNVATTGREVEGRRKDGSLIPLDLAIAEWRDATGKRFFTGIMRDISARRAEEARRALLMREVDHRAKNVLAVVQSVVRLTPREEPQAFAAAVEARVATLARAHSLLAEGGWHGADLRAAAERALAPFTPGPGRGAVKLSGPPIPLTPAAVQPIAMVLHELATNAAKYGALSVASGTVTVEWQATRDSGVGQLRVLWTEADGPTVPNIPARRSFGSRLIDATVRGQLGGEVMRRWHPTGLVCIITLPLDRAVVSSGDPAAFEPDADIPSHAA
jgi:PAS domain S-box-containing protein